jgi:hypothetical protein
MTVVISVGLKRINFTDSSSELMTSLEITAQGRALGFKIGKKPFLRPKTEGGRVCEINLPCRLD